MIDISDVYINSNPFEVLDFNKFYVGKDIFNKVIDNIIKSSRKENNSWINKAIKNFETSSNINISDNFYNEYIKGSKSEYNPSPIRGSSISVNCNGSTVYIGLNHYGIFKTK